MSDPTKQACFCKECRQEIPCPGVICNECYIEELEQRAEKAESDLAEERMKAAEDCKEFLEMRADRDRLQRMAQAVDVLIAESKGVDGFHLNGAIATWEEVLPEWFEGGEP